MKDVDDYLWNPKAAPDETVARLERALRQYRHVPAPLRTQEPARPHRPLLRGFVSRHIYALAASVFMLFLGQLVLVKTGTPWKVVTETGRVAVTGPYGGERLRVGSVVATGQFGRARVHVGRVGQVTLSPQSEMEVVRDDDTGHRLRLRHGEIHARIWAPARFFVVETQFATATDLGCVYNLRVSAEGDGMLEVLQGAVELARGGDTVYIASGIKAHVSENGIGVPRPMLSSDEFQAAVKALEDGSVDPSNMSTVLHEPGAQSTVSLFYLLPKLPDSLRTAVVQRIIELVPLPDSLLTMRQRVQQLESGATTSWQNALRPHWSSEPGSRVRRWLVKWGLSKPLVVLDMMERE